MGKFLVVQIGCIECGVSSYPIALVDDKERADRVAAAWPSTWATEGGDGYVEVWDLSKEGLDPEARLLDKTHSEPAVFEKMQAAIDIAGGK